MKSTQVGRSTLIHADAFDWLAQRRAQSIHAVVSDPPFAVAEYLQSELDRKRRGKGLWRLPQAFDGVQRQAVPRFTALTPSMLADLDCFHRRLATLLKRVLVPGGHVILASQNLLMHRVLGQYESAGFEPRGLIARVVKTLRGGDRPKGAHAEYPELSVCPRSSWEPWIILRKPCEGTVSANLKRWHAGALRRPSQEKPFRDLIESSPASRKERAIAPHPSLKPQAFLRQVVRASLPLGIGVILDPFMGSGSTIAAAEAAGFRAIGIEVDADFFRLARKAVPGLTAIGEADSRAVA